jgi:hypothetical protein
MLNSRIYGNYPKQEYLYLYVLPIYSFTQTKIDEHQFVSLVSVKPLKTIKIKISECHNLTRIGTEK